MIFNERDPIGRPVILKKATWEYKICNYGGANDDNVHGNSHPEMQELQERVKESITSPHFIIKDEPSEQLRPGAEREEYFKIYFNEQLKMRVIKTIVEFSTDKEYGEVVTTHKIAGKMDKVKKEGDIVYDASTNPE